MKGIALTGVRHPHDAARVDENNTSRQKSRSGQFTYANEVPALVDSETRNRQSVEQF